MADRPRQSLNLPVDIRKSPEWGRGYLDRWEKGRQVAATPAISSSPDPCDALRDWFARTDRVVVLGRGPSATEPWARALPQDVVLTTGTTYARRDVFTGDPLGVVIGDRPNELSQLAARFTQTPPERRPLLMHTYIPEYDQADFVGHGLPRPVPILPLLIREDLYTHRADEPYPTTGVFMVMLGVALGKRVDVAGIDNYDHPSGNVYSNVSATQFVLPGRHSRACDLEHLRKAQARAKAPVTLTPHVQSMLESLT